MDIVILDPDNFEPRAKCKKCSKYHAKHGKTSCTRTRASNFFFDLFTQLVNTNIIKVAFVHGRNNPHENAERFIYSRMKLVRNFFVCLSQFQNPFWY